MSISLRVTHNTRSRVGGVVGGWCVGCSVVGGWVGGCSVVGGRAGVVDGWGVAMSGTVAQVVIGYSEAAFLLFWVPIPLYISFTPPY